MLDFWWCWDLGPAKSSPWWWHEPIHPFLPSPFIKFLRYILCKSRYGSLILILLRLSNNNKSVYKSIKRVCTGDMNFLLWTTSFSNEHCLPHNPLFWGHGAGTACASDTTQPREWGADNCFTGKAPAAGMAWAPWAATIGISYTYELEPKDLEGNWSLGLQPWRFGELFRAVYKIKKWRKQERKTLAEPRSCGGRGWQRTGLHAQLSGALFWTLKAQLQVEAQHGLLPAGEGWGPVAPMPFSALL